MPSAAVAGALSGAAVPGGPVRAVRTVLFQGSVLDPEESLAPLEPELGALAEAATGEARQVSGAGPRLAGGSLHPERAAAAVRERACRLYGAVVPVIEGPKARLLVVSCKPSGGVLRFTRKGK